MRSQIQRVGLFLVVAVLVSVPSMRGASVGPDAGTGVDAGGTMGSALALPSWGLLDATALPHDTDVFTISLATTTARCVTLDASGTFGGTFSLATNLGETVYGVGRPVTSSMSRVALATDAADAAWIQVMRQDNAAAVKAYSANTVATQLPSATANDAGTAVDAGATPASALSVATNCIGGSLGPKLGIEDAVDLFALSASGGEVVTYSLGTPDATTTLQLVDANGGALGPSIGSGGIARVPIATGGTYYLQASSASTQSQPYLIGLVIGPDPGSGCRPTC